MARLSCELAGVLSLRVVESEKQTSFLVLFRVILHAVFMTLTNVRSESMFHTVYEYSYLSFRLASIEAHALTKKLRELVIFRALSTLLMHELSHFLPKYRMFIIKWIIVVSLMRGCHMTWMISQLSYLLRKFLCHFLKQM
jgi:hypothetical protein